MVTFYCNDFIYHKFLNLKKLNLPDTILVLEFWEVWFPWKPAFVSHGFLGVDLELFEGPRYLTHTDVTLCGL